MAFYAHPYFAQSPARSASPSPAAHGYHGHAYGPHPFSHAYQPRHPFYHHAQEDHASVSLDEEERLAYAHLQSIQRRREAEQAAIQREAAARYQAQQQREAAIAKALAAERKREAAIQLAIEQEKQRRQRQLEIEVQRERAIKAREEAIRAAIAEREQARREYIKQKGQAERRRYADAVAIAKARAEAEQEARARHHRRHLEHALARRNACARRCAKAAEKVDDKEEERDEGLEALNALFGSLFGIRFTHSVDEKPATTAASAEQKAEAANAAPASAPVTEGNTKPAEAESDRKDQADAFPEAINDILSHFLGLRVEPTASSEQTSNVKQTENKVPEGLNELLSQFGLVFEPTCDSDNDTKTAAPSSEPVAATTGTADKAAATEQPEVADPPEAPLPTSLPTPGPSASSSSSKQQQHEQTPLTAFLDNAAHLPPFVRDILGNVELAFKEQAERKRDEKKEVEVEGKGKGVAEGEKKARSPAPVSASASTATATAIEDAALSTSSSSLDQLSSIEHDLHLLTASFEFPSTLSFSSSSPADSAPALLFNRTNSGYHAQTNKLLQLLLAADGITSAGDKDVRIKRKELVKKVEGEIEKLEKKRDQVWLEVKEKRERGEVEEVEDERSWSGSEKSHSRAASVVDEEEELAMEVDGFEVDADASQHDKLAEESAQTTSDTEVTPETVTEHVEHVSESTPAAEHEQVEEAPKTFADAAKAEPKEDTGKDHKEDGYELL